MHRPALVYGLLSQVPAPRLHGEGTLITERLLEARLQARHMQTFSELRATTSYKTGTKMQFAKDFTVRETEVNRGIADHKIHGSSTPPPLSPFKGGPQRGPPEGSVLPKAPLSRLKEV